VLGPASAYVIVNPTTQNGGYSPALAQIDRINRSNGAVDHGGTFPGAGVLALAGGYLWVANRPSPGVASTKGDICSCA